MDLLIASTDMFFAPFFNVFFAADNVADVPNEATKVTKIPCFLLFQNCLSLFEFLLKRIWLLLIDAHLLSILST